MLAPSYEQAVGNVAGHVHPGLTGFLVQVVKQHIGEVRGERGISCIRNELRSTG